MAVRRKTDAAKKSRAPLNLTGSCATEQRMAARQAEWKRKWGYEGGGEGGGGLVRLFLVQLVLVWLVSVWLVSVLLSV